ncbi:helix-turn-helix domain-containing protein [Kribbella sp. NBC_01245]|uniref:AfsR/SARP family transcriptional regulator n=1 Tax=Kribbella sp. NBC_01245 TaxID=2903578 RepID=UPI002E2802F5|nr:helix-turn-helix domain-containing protein [Kribbella sp. NBC_01245]
MLLAVLALSAGEPVSADALIARVWGEPNLSAERGNLYTYVRRLRSVLGSSAIATAGADIGWTWTRNAWTRAGSWHCWTARTRAGPTSTRTMSPNGCCWVRRWTFGGARRTTSSRTG